MSPLETNKECFMKIAYCWAAEWPKIRRKQTSFTGLLWLTKGPPVGSLSSMEAGLIQISLLLLVHFLSWWLAHYWSVWVCLHIHTLSHTDCRLEIFTAVITSVPVPVAGIRWAAARSLNYKNKYRIEQHCSGQAWGLVICLIACSGKSVWLGLFPSHVVAVRVERWEGGRRQ